MTKIKVIEAEKFPGGGGDSTYERGGDARRKVWIKPLKETDMGVASEIYSPKRDDKHPHHFDMRSPPCPGKVHFAFREHQWEEIIYRLEHFS